MSSLIFSRDSWSRQEAHTDIPHIFRYATKNRALVFTGDLLRGTNSLAIHLVAVLTFVSELSNYMRAPRIMLYASANVTAAFCSSLLVCRHRHLRTSPVSARGTRNGRCPPTAGLRITTSVPRSYLQSSQPHLTPPPFNTANINRDALG